MDDKTIAALLALPDGARDALRGCEGPGWALSARLNWLSHDADEYAAEPGTAFLPCSPLEIVRVATKKAGADGGHIFQDNNPEGWLFCAVLEPWDVGHQHDAQTPHLAALALLGDVWGAT